MTMTFTGTREEAFKLWTEALRSGKYDKGTGLLHGRDNEFCCLGVLCEVLGVNKEVIGADGYTIYGGDDIDQASGAVLPAEVAKFMQMDVSGQMINPILSGSDQRSLTVINDYTSATFSDIADIIEKNIGAFEPYHDID